MGHFIAITTLASWHLHCAQISIKMVQYSFRSYPCRDSTFYNQRWESRAFSTVFDTALQSYITAHLAHCSYRAYKADQLGNSAKNWEAWLRKVDGGARGARFHRRFAVVVVKDFFPCFRCAEEAREEVLYDDDGETATTMALCGLNLLRAHPVEGRVWQGRRGKLNTCLLFKDTHFLSFSKSILHFSRIVIFFARNWGNDWEATKLKMCLILRQCNHGKILFLNLYLLFTQPEIVMQKSYYLAKNTIYVICQY